MKRATVGEAGPDERLADLITRYEGLIRSAIRRVGRALSRADADDIQQNVAIALWQQLRREQIIEHPASYLYKAAVRETVRAVRRTMIRPVVPVEDADAVPASSDDPERLAARGEQLEGIQEALATLAPDRRKAVTAHLAGFEVAEIMDMHGWSYQRARNLVARGLADLRRELGKESGRE